MSSSPGHLPGRLFLYVTVFLTGAAVMNIEIVGTRIFSPYFGSSIYVWASLITVTLVSLACGYWAGGIVADRVPRLRVLCWILPASSILIISALLLVKPLAGLTSGWDIRISSLFNALVIFGPSLAALGMVTTVALRLSTLQVEEVGRVAGRLYALSTLGSVAGTLLAAFVLIPVVPISRIFCSLALMLALLSLAGWMIDAGKTGKLYAVLIAVSLCAVSFSWNLKVKTVQAGTVHQDQGF